MEEKKKSNIKKIILGSFLGILIGSIMGTTYAMFTYNSTSINNKLIVGDIYMRYKEDNTLTIENATPRTGPMENGYFEFTIEGKNTTTNKDIWYDVVLSHGELPITGNRTEDNRIDDSFLRFKLVEVTNNVESEDLLETNNFNNLTNRRIYVNKILHGTEPSHTYRLYMWIDNSVVIGNTNDADYTTSEWNNLFASIKVNVTGDFEEKELNPPAPEICFITNDKDNNTVDIKGLVKDKYQRNINMTSTELQACVDYFTNTRPISGDPTAFCQGTGRIGQYSPYFDDILSSSSISNYLSSTQVNDLIELNVIQFIEAPSECKNIRDLVIPSTINGKKVTSIGQNIYGAFRNDQFTSVVIPYGVTTIGSEAFINNQLTSVEIPNSVTSIGHSAFRENQLTSIEIPNSVTSLMSGAFERNKLTSVVLPNSITTIPAGAFFQNKLTSVTIPNSITTIEWGAFQLNQLTSVEIPNSVTTIDYDAFRSNFLTSIEIPNSVTTIGDSAFLGNQLTNVTIGNGITSIGESAFSKSNNTETINGRTYYNNPNLTSITIDKSCNDIKNNLLSYGNNKYPWLHYSSPYIGIGGVTIYGSNNEVCDSFPSN